METIRRQPLWLVTLAFLTMAGAACMLAGCQEKPGAPAFDNIFDPLNPSSENPLNVKVSLGDTLITVIWDFPPGFDITTYEILHSLDPPSGFSSLGSFEPLETIPPQTVGIFRYANPEPTTTHYIMVLAFMADGSHPLISDMVAVVAVTPPLVIAGNGTGYSASRYLDLTITVSSEESLLISAAADFSDPLEVAVTDPGSPQTVAWDLGPAAENLENKELYVLAFTGSALSDTAEIELTARFQPAFTAVGKPSTVATRTIDLEIPVTGVVAMRFASSEDDLATAEWVPGAAVFSDYQLSDSLNPQDIFGEFEGDFGFNHSSHYTAKPDALTDATFELDLPETGVTDDATVTCLCSATATEMRFAETPTFIGVPWQNYADSAPFTLTPEEGAKTVYAQFRNDWTESAILTDEVIYVTQPADVAFTTPAEGDEVTGGTTLQLRGTSTAQAGTGVVDAVKVDTGDGSGFHLAAGTEEWTYWWDIPDHEATTPTVLRARAYANEDSVTAVLNVTVIPAPVR